MDSEVKSCQNCKNPFTIEQEDFAFYGKINVPPPTWCPECRMVRRMAQMNQRKLYKRSCERCNQNIISVFPAETEHTVYCAKCWWSDEWDPLRYGKDYDFTKSFFEQLKDLAHVVPHAGKESLETTLENSDYVNLCSYLKNCYLVYNSDYCEDCAYSTLLERSKRCLDLYMADLCEGCYDSNNLYKDYHVRFSSNCNECFNVSFSRNLIGCSDCFGCVNLRNKQYYIFNQPYSKEEYAAKIAEFDTGSYKAVQEIKERVARHTLSYPRRYVEGLHNTNVTGDYIFNSKNVSGGHEVGSAEDSKYCQFLTIAPTKDSYDFTLWGGNATRMYECMGAGGGGVDIKFCYECWTNATNLTYCRFILAPCSHLFGCIGLRNKKYCILNKQYTKEEYEKLVPKIIEHMNAMPYVDAQGRTYKYGEFFPPELSSFAYNETIAQEYHPLTKEDASRQGYRWDDGETKNYTITKKSEELPDHIRDVSDAILADIIACAHRGSCDDQCSTAFKIIPEELAFYRSQNLPLPRLCSNCRHYERLRMHNPMTLWQRKCNCSGGMSQNGAYKNESAHFHADQPCPNEFETSYAPERAEIVYCESCYQSEVA